MSSSIFSSKGGFRTVIAIAAVGFVILNLAAWKIVESGHFTELPLLKQAQFRKGNFDCVILGNSRVLYGVIPEIFDREMAAHGHQVRSYNFGIKSASIEDQEMIAREFVWPAKPRLLLLQSDCIWYDSIRTSSEPALPRTAGYFGEAGDAWRFWRSDILDREAALSVTVGSWFPMFRYRLEMRQFLTPWRDPDFYRKPKAMLTEGGYASQDRDPELAGAEESMTPPLRDARLDNPAMVENIVRLAQEAMGRGIEVVVVEYPSSLYTPTEEYRERMRKRFSRMGVSYLTYVAPAWFGKREIYFDSAHLNPHGANAFSQVLARDIAGELVRQTGGPHSDKRSQGLPESP